MQRTRASDLSKGPRMAQSIAFAADASRLAALLHSYLPARRAFGPPCTPGAPRRRRAAGDFVARRAAAHGALGGAALIAVLQRPRARSSLLRRVGARPRSRRRCRELGRVLRRSAVRLFSSRDLSPARARSM